MESTQSNPNDWRSRLLGAQDSDKTALASGNQAWVEAQGYLRPKLIQSLWEGVIYVPILIIFILSLSTLTAAHDELEYHSNGLVG